MVAIQKVTTRARRNVSGPPLLKNSCKFFRQTSSLTRTLTGKTWRGLHRSPGWARGSHRCGSRTAGPVRRSISTLAKANKVKVRNKNVLIIFFYNLLCAMRSSVASANLKKCYLCVFHCFTCNGCPQRCPVKRTRWGLAGLSIFTLRIPSRTSRPLCR